MNRHIYLVLLSVAFSGLLFTGCKKWDDHNALTDTSVGKNLLEQISENTDLSKFSELLTKSGYDTVIASSKTFTVFAPTNAALASLDPAIIADAARLRGFVGNHITNQLYQTSTTTGQRRIQMLSGKYNNLQGQMFEDANITVANKYAKNGFLQVLDKMVPVLPNAWEFLETSPLAPVKQKQFLLSQFVNVFNAATAVQTGVDPTTGRPIYQAGTDSIRTNLFWRDIYDLRDETKQFTFFVLTDAAWDQEVQNYRPLSLIPTSTDSTTLFASRTVTKDLAVEGVYSRNAIPDTILSKFNTKVGIDKSAIVQTIKVSNGIVYIMSKLNVRPKDKFPQYVIQGENYDFTSANRTSNTWFRNRLNPLTGQQYRDVTVYNHGLALFNLGYRLTNVPAAKYKAYWVAVHDNINGFTATFKQKIGIGTPTSTLLNYVTVNLNDYSEIYLGEFTLTTFNPTLNIHLTADNTTTATANLITLDYVRLEPVL